MHPLNIEYLQKPKPIDKLPFQKVWVFDNYLTPPIWWSWINWRNSSVNWGRSNRVIRNDEMQHLYWGESIYHNVGEEKNSWHNNTEIQENGNEYKSTAHIGEMDYRGDTREGLKHDPGHLPDP